MSLFEEFYRLWLDKNYPQRDLFGNKVEPKPSAHFEKKKGEKK